MKRVKLAGILCLAILTMISITAVSASAQSLNPLALAEDYITAVKFSISHPKETMDIVKASISRQENSEVENIINSSPGAQALLRIYNVPNTGATIGKSLVATVNPQNTEQNRILCLKVGMPSDSYRPSFSSGNNQQERRFTVLTTPNFYSNTINIDPIIVWEDSQNNLVVLGVVKNFSGKNVMINAIPSIDLVANNKVFASGVPSGLEAPMELSYYQEKVNSGVYDGLPTQCFIIMVFAPGTYDDTVDISSLDSIECNYSLDYSYLD